MGAVIQKQMEANARRFSEGSDARLAGKPLRACPYHGLNQANDRLYWIMGWKDVHRCWGKYVGRRWWYAELVPVMG